ncbi:MAG: hypothetical protein DMG95_05405 [Acidobacteria bacterium]|jgi:hypothetical protein|nr:MAG: hypothetical protein DMG95_05405 [Acidobacteriota bacterium]
MSGLADFQQAREAVFKATGWVAAARTRMIRYTSNRTMMAQEAIANGNNLAAHESIISATRAVFSGATFTTLMATIMLNFITQQSAQPAPSDTRRNTGKRKSRPRKAGSIL